MTNIPPEPEVPHEALSHSPTEIFGYVCALAGRCRAALAEVDRLGKAFDDQSRELEIACEVMTPDQLTEFRHRAYPTLHPRPVTLISSNPESWLGA